MKIRLYNDDNQVELLLAGYGPFERLEFSKETMANTLYGINGDSYTLIARTSKGKWKILDSDLPVTRFEVG